MTFEDDTLESFCTRITGSNFLLSTGIHQPYCVIFWPPCFALVKEHTEATEGAGNPGFNMSSPELSAHQTPKEKVIRRDVPDHTLAAHRQKSRLPASAGPKGVTSVPIMLTLGDAYCSSHLTWASWTGTWHSIQACPYSFWGRFDWGKGRWAGDAVEDPCSH